jgi:acyl CoA:acetate/3-ketoacid CoA transferase alpha subunit
MIALLRAAECRPGTALATRFLQNPDERIRREAVLWCLDTPETRERAIIEGLRDSSSDVLRPALQAARSGLPHSAVPVLAKRVLDTDFPPGFRVLALSLLGRSGNVLALEALLHFAASGRTLLGRPRLAGKSPEMIAAVTALARTWRADRHASGILQQALRSRDPQVVTAAETGSVEIS